MGRNVRQPRTSPGCRRDTRPARGSKLTLLSLLARTVDGYHPQLSWLLSSPQPSPLLSSPLLSSPLLSSPLLSSPLLSSPLLSSPLLSSPLLSSPLLSSPLLSSPLLSSPLLSSPLLSSPLLSSPLLSSPSSSHFQHVHGRGTINYGGKECDLTHLQHSSYIIHPKIRTTQSFIQVT